MIQPVLAYVDPGSGLLVWQMIGSAFVGTLFYFKKTRQALAALARKVTRRR